MKHISSTLQILILTGVFLGLKADAGDVTTVQLGHTLLRIPSEYLLPSLPASMVPTSGMDADEGITLKIPYADLGLSNSNPSHADRSLMVFITTPGDYLKTHGVGMDAYNAWQGAHLYRHRIVEKDPNTDWYRVGSKAAFPVFWHVFTTPPNDTTKPGDAWVATCHEDNGEQASSTCYVESLYLDLDSKLTLPEEDITLLSELEAGYHREMDSWRISEQP